MTEAETADTLTIDIDGWEGPLDLLLALARNQKVDLRQISILDLVEQYLAFVNAARALKLELAADYLVMAAWLAYLKSALLLPRNPEEVAQPRGAGAAPPAPARAIERDARGGRAADRARPAGRDVFVRAAPEGLRVLRKARWEAEIYDLIAAYGRISARTRPVMHVVAVRDVMTLEEAIDRVARLVGSRIDWSTIESFLPDEATGTYRKSALASSFVAALELARQGRIELRQKSAFAPLYLKASA